MVMTPGFDTRESSTGALRPLVSFLNHGRMPFVGRDRELGRLHALVEQQAEAEGLRLALVVGEAGSGKSALAAALSASIARPDRAVIRLRLHPGGSTAIGPAVAGAVLLAPIGRGLLRAEPDGGLPGAIDALRRVGGLRATTLLIEDLHLLSGDSLHDLGRLLDGVADLSIAVTAFSRPLDAEAHGVLARWLVDQITLEPLSLDDVGEIWRTIFASPVSREIIATLHEATLGAPLALRSALRTAVSTGWIADDGAGWRATVSADALGEHLRRSVDLIPRGMIAHLSDEERAAAALLSTLGEVFARSAAQSLIEDADRLVDELTFRGVLLPVVAPPRPFVGEHRDLDVRMFAHTLLHRHLSRSAHGCARLLAHAVATGAPLYSTLPLELIRDGIGAESPPSTGIAVGAVRRLVAGARSVDRTSDWQLGPLLLDAADAIASTIGETISPIDRRILALDLLRWRLNALRRGDESEEFRELLERYVAATMPPVPPELVEHRISALRALALTRCHFDGVSPIDCWREMEAFIAEHPAGRRTEAYLSYLLAMATLAIFHHDHATAQIIEARFEEIERDADPGDTHIAVARIRLRTKLLSVFATREELERRLRHLASLEREGQSVDLAMHTAMLLTETGRFADLVALVDEWLPRYERMGLTRNAAQFAVLRVTARVMLGADLRDARAQIDRLVASARPAVRARMSSAARSQLALRCLLLGEEASIDEIVDGLERSGLDMEAISVAKAVATGGSDALRELAISDPLLVELASLSCGRTVPDSERLEATVRASITGLPSLIGRLVMLHGALTLLRTCEPSSSLERVRGLLHDPVIEMLRGLDELGNGALLLPLVERSRQVLTKREIEGWRATAHRLLRERALSSDADGAMPRVSMLGSVAVDLDGSGVTAVRGARVRALLGLLVVDRILGRTLDRQELAALASGEQGDPESARRALNGIVLRLRELLGADSVLTDGELPRLHPGVRVDLLEALASAREAEEACAQLQLSRAFASALALFAKLDGRVPFPGMYDAIFETAREEIEATARHCALRVSGALRAAGDLDGAAAVLRKAVDALPGDEELAERLAAVLESDGRQLEARRARA